IAIRVIKHIATNAHTTWLRWYTRPAPARRRHNDIRWEGQRRTGFGIVIIVAAQAAPAQRRHHTQREYKNKNSFQSHNESPLYSSHKLYRRERSRMSSPSLLDVFASLNEGDDMREDVEEWMKTISFSAFSATSAVSSKDGNLSEFKI